MEIVKVDKTGRMIIPEEIRRRVGIKQDSPLLITDVDGNTIVVRKLNIDEVAAKLKEELKDLDIDALYRKVKAEADEKARKEISPLLT